MAKNNSKGRTDWSRLKKIDDKKIRAAVSADPEAAPIVSADWIRQARLLEPKSKKAVSIRLDEDVLDWFRQHGKGYQTRINAVLRAYVDTHDR